MSIPVWKNLLSVMGVMNLVAIPRYAFPIVFPNLSSISSDPSLLIIYNPTRGAMKSAAKFCASADRQRDGVLGFWGFGVL
ncbi:MAG: hypothetical protein P4M11_07630, partial [Candidatus Pacebacteria bacterium]|nr:hypothetical protein [Candidatus Paceibacterota bacterium]